MDAAPATLTVALWALNLARPVTGIQAWAAAVEARMAEARADGADLLVMPEHAGAQWLSFAPPDLAFHQEIAWLAGHTEAALEALQPLPARYGMALLAGTLPVKASGPCYLNRAHLLLPNGRIVAQVLLARDLPIGKIRELRHGGAEVWPGAWNADHVSIVEAEEDNPL